MFYTISLPAGIDKIYNIAEFVNKICYENKSMNHVSRYYVTSMHDK
jgi:hypothetical protein